MLKLARTTHAENNKSTLTAKATDSGDKDNQDGERDDLDGGRDNLDGETDHLNGDKDNQDGERDDLDGGRDHQNGDKDNLDSEYYNEGSHIGNERSGSLNNDAAFGGEQSNDRGAGHESDYEGDGDLGDQHSNEEHDSHE